MNLSIKELAEEQRILREKIIIEPYTKSVRYVLGIDSSYSKVNNRILSVALLYDILSNEVVEYACKEGEAKFPYIPGYLSFREIPTTLLAVKMIKSRYDIIMVDAQGIAHPRGLGFAAHLGVLLNFPTIGCAKKRLVGEYSEVENIKGSFSLLYVKGVACGAVLRTKVNTKPLFVSPGHKTDIVSAVNIVLKSTSRYRLPDPLRLAHGYSKREINEV
ncbi:MAG: deoxyribonuclease V [bacterium]